MQLWLAVLWYSYARDNHDDDDYCCCCSTAAAAVSDMAILAVIAIMLGFHCSYNDDDVDTLHDCSTYDFHSL